MNSEINIGDCFLFKANSKVYAFIAFGSWKYKRQLNIKFIPVTFSIDITHLDDVVSHGQVFSKDVLNGQTWQNEPGIFMFDIGLDENELLEQFKYVGKLDIDREKAFCCGGTGGLQQDLFVRYLLWLDNGMTGHVKLTLKEFIKA